ncbi:Nicotinamide n-methyltransferase [Apiospora phragmitis]|uniref:Nicotinamide n-methyltransferase n=1 Tax=Apiospora phragmitis TaxID=2905665 RepID=A0ABR1T8D2_9PEZI
MGDTSSPIRTKRLFNWDSNYMGKADENTPFLVWKELILEEQQFTDPLDEFLTQKYTPLNRIAAWMDDSSRTYSGVMTDAEFRENLTEKRLGHETLPDALIRRIHIPSPHPETISSLICSVPKNQAAVLGGFLKRHIKGEGLVSLRFVDAMNTFVMECHLPFWVWGDRAAGTKRQDDRETRDGGSLRKTEDLSFLARPTELDVDKGEYPAADCLYEAQSSCVVTGYNNSYWTAISLADTYFYPGGIDNDAPDCDENEDMLPFYKDEKDLDPLTIDTVCSPSKIALAHKDGHANPVHQSYEWVTGSMSVLEQLQATLIKLINACDHFDQYELPILIGPESSNQLLLPPIQEIRQSILELHILQDDLLDICRQAEYFKQKFDLLLSVVDNSATVLQQQNHTANFTYIQYFGAPTLAAGLFQANVLAGATFVRFLLSSVVIAILGFMVQRLQDMCSWSTLWDRLILSHLPSRPQATEEPPKATYNETSRVNGGPPLGWP